MMDVRIATPADIPVIMEIERQPGYDMLISQRTVEQHTAHMDDLANVYLLAEQGTVRGLCILEGISGSWGNVQVRTVAVSQPGTGLGSRMLPPMIDLAFAEPETHRLWLYARGDNERALRCYRRAGFVDEGGDREAFRMADGTRTDLVRLSMLRPEWQVLKTASAG